MKAKVLVIIGLVVLGGALVWTVRSRQASNSQGVAQQAPTPTLTATPETVAQEVPAHYETPPSDLEPTLPPENFSGPTREAYQVAKVAPRLLTQLPCYCHCDHTMGHKSLHSCYETLHAASCAVCVNEALMAYRLEKEGLSAKQIRDRIVAEFSKADM